MLIESNIIIIIMIHVCPLVSDQDESNVIVYYYVYCGSILIVLLSLCSPLLIWSRRC